MTAAHDLAWLTVAEAGELLRTKKLSPVEYAKALIARADELDPKLNAYLRRTPDIALEDARRPTDEVVVAVGDRIEGARIDRVVLQVHVASTRSSRFDSRRLAPRQ